MEKSLLKKYSKVRTEADKNGHLVFVVEYYKTEESEPIDKCFSVGDILEMFLSKLKATAETFSSSQVDGCVLSYPAYFGQDRLPELQKVSDKVFGKTVLVKESVASLFPYNDDEKLLVPDNLDRTFAVIDFGAHQTSVSIIQDCEGTVNVRYSASDDTIGGDLFDDLLVKIMADEFRKKTRADLYENPRAVAKLRKACEQTKKTLSQRDNAPCFVESLYEGMDFNTQLNRGKFEVLADPIFKKCFEFINSSLETSGLSAEDIDQVILIGGSTKMPRFQSGLKSIFPDISETSRITSIIDPSEITSRGCAVLAREIADTGFDELQAKIAERNEQSTMAIPCSFAFEDTSGKLSTLIPSLTPVPVDRTVELSDDFKDAASLTIYECPQGRKDKKTVFAKLDFPKVSSDVDRSDIKFTLNMSIDETGKVRIELMEESTGVSTEVNM